MNEWWMQVKVVLRADVSASTYDKVAVISGAQPNLTFCLLQQNYFIHSTWLILFIL